MSMNSRTVARLFDSYSDAAAAVRDLEAAGFSHDDVSLVANRPEGTDDATTTTTTVAEGETGTAAGAGTGATLGTHPGRRRGPARRHRRPGDPGPRPDRRGGLAGGGPHRRGRRRGGGRPARRADPGRRRRGARPCLRRRRAPRRQPRHRAHRREPRGRGGGDHVAPQRRGRRQRAARSTAKAAGAATTRTPGRTPGAAPPPRPAPAWALVSPAWPGRCRAARPQAPAWDRARRTARPATRPARWRRGASTRSPAPTRAAPTRRTRPARPRAAASAPARRTARRATRRAPWRRAASTRPPAPTPAAPIPENETRSTTRAPASGSSAPDGTPGNPPGTMASRGLDQAAGTNTSGAYPENETRSTTGSGAGLQRAGRHAGQPAGHDGVARPRRGRGHQCERCPS